MKTRKRRYFRAKIRNVQQRLFDSDYAAYQQRRKELGL